MTPVLILRYEFADRGQHVPVYLFRPRREADLSLRHAPLEGSRVGGSRSSRLLLLLLLGLHAALRLRDLIGCVYPIVIRVELQVLGQGRFEELRINVREELGRALC